eukprot:6204547-Pleurochrysis_carterae.AAC.1
MASRSTTWLATVRQRAQARGLGAPMGRLWVGGARGRGRPCAREESRAWGSERARALREYACGASTIWETVHVSVELQHMATFPSIVPHDM